ncbi:MAG: hydrogenase iron-sulfur subunit, partial [Dehalococcoidia bacterium]
MTEQAVKEKPTKEKAATGFKPKIIVFCCNWCSYAGADLAGTSRLKINPNFRVIRTMCSGRVEPTFVFHAFAKG